MGGGVISREWGVDNEVVLINGWGLISGGGWWIMRRGC